MGLCFLYFRLGGAGLGAEKADDGCAARVDPVLAAHLGIDLAEGRPQQLQPVLLRPFS